MAVDLEAEPHRRSLSGWVDQVLARAGACARTHGEPSDCGVRRKPSKRRNRHTLQPAETAPLAVPGFAAAADPPLGAPFARGARASSGRADPEEIIARALCHDDPDTPTHRGPLWTGYRKEARRVLGALRAAGLLVDRP
jgi:hypothetical protein